MAVREFDGTDDNIITNIGGLSAMTFGTFAAMFKRDTSGATNSLLNIENSSHSAITEFGVRGATNTMVFYNNIANSIMASPTIATTDWYLCVMRKGTGTVAPRFSLYDMNTATWSHGNGDTAQADWSAHPTGFVGMSWNTFEYWNGRVAVRAAWSNSLPWSADTTGDAAIEAAGLEDNLQAWVDAAPSAGWVFNQDSVATPLPDWTGGGADELSIVGTTVVTGDDPPEFNFTLGAPPPVLEEGPATAEGRSNMRLG